MKVKFKEYREHSTDKNLEEGTLCLCECPRFCEEGIMVAVYTKGGFLFSGHGYMDKHVTGYVPLDIQS